MESKRKRNNNVCYGFLLVMAVGTLLTVLNFRFPGSYSTIVSMCVTVLALMISICLSYSAFIISVPNEYLKKYWEGEPSRKTFTNQFQYDIRFLIVSCLDSILSFFLSWLFMHLHILYHDGAGVLFYNIGICTSFYNVIVTVIYFYNVISLHKVSYDEKVKQVEAMDSVSNEETTHNFKIDIQGCLNCNVKLNIKDGELHLEINRML